MYLGCQAVTSVRTRSSSPSNAGRSTRTIFSPSLGDSNSWRHSDHFRSFEAKSVIIITSSAVACQSAPLSGMTFSFPEPPRYLFLHPVPGEETSDAACSQAMGTAALLLRPASRCRRRGRGAPAAPAAPASAPATVTEEAAAAGAGGLAALVLHLVQRPYVCFAWLRNGYI